MSQAVPSAQSAGLTIHDLSKTFPGQRALNAVSMTFRPGSVTALLGHNGSGKSTLIKILAGFHKPDPGEGSVHINGVPLALPMTARASHHAGLRFVHQDLGLVDAMTIADNFAFADRFLTRGQLGGIRDRRERRRVGAAFAQLGIAENPDTIVRRLSPTIKALVALARAVQHIGQDPHGDVPSGALILDEPTASLPSSDVNRVLEVVRHVRDLGWPIVYVTHRVDEVLSVADQVVVLRGGSVIAQRELAGLQADELVELIAGQAISPNTASVNSRRDQDVVLTASKLSGVRLREASFEVHRGEILGVAGLTGCGRSELARLMTGAQTHMSGTLTWAGREYRPRNPKEALTLGVASVPQDRAHQGCILGLPIQDNLTLGTLKWYTRFGWLQLRRERADAAKTIDRFGISPANPRALLRNLSGGNQQKVVIAKALRHRPSLLVLDEPMQGIDVGAKRQLSQIIREFVAEGRSAVVCSTDLEDLTALCDRVLVLSRGHVVGLVAGVSLTEERLILLSSGVASDRDAGDEQA